MIVLDEHLKGLGLEAEVARWYPGSVVTINSLRPGTLIADDAIPGILRQQHRALFVTLNWTDFWGRVPADRRYCVVCLALPVSEVDALPTLLRRLFRCPGFETAAKRAGKVVRLATGQAFYYGQGDVAPHPIPW